MHEANAQPSRLSAMTRALTGLLASVRSVTTKASAVAPLIALDGNRQPVWAPRDYATFAREGMMQNPVAFRSVRMIAEAAASVPLLLYDRDTEIETHWLLDVLARPAPGQIGVDLLEALFSSLLVAGNAYVEAVAAADGIRELHVLRADRVQVIPGPDGWSDGYAYSAAGQTVRITEVGDHGVRTIEARSLDPQVYARNPQPQRVATTAPPVATGQPAVHFLDLPLLRGDEPPSAGYVAAVQVPWPGALAVYRSPEATGFTLQGFVNAASAVGETLDPLGAGPEGRIDRATMLRVMLASGQTLTSATTIKMLSGANVAAVLTPAGEWELLQFETATLVAANTYELANLLRGQAGTEGATTTVGIPAGAPFVMLGAGLTRLDLSPGDIGLPFVWRVGPAAKELGSTDYLEATHAFRGVGARPLSPVHVRGSRSGGDLTITWVRRTRSGGDSWDAVEIPLAEDIEAYELDIMDGATIKRTLASSTPAVAYTAAQQIADFGAVQTAVSVRVFQLSTVWGRGTGRAAIV